MNTNILKTAVQSLKKSKVMIHYSLQLVDSVQRGNIKPEHFEKRLIIPEKSHSNYYKFELDWEKFPEIFKETTEDAHVFISSYALITCKELCTEDTWVIESEDPDLFAAQNILKLIRNAMAHVKFSIEDNTIRPHWKILNNKAKRIFNVGKLNITLDATNLHDKPFELNHIGGFANLLKILNFMIDELERKIKQASSSQS
jgi:hypothetical protein